MPRCVGRLARLAELPRWIPPGEVLRCVRGADLDARVGTALFFGHADQVRPSTNRRPRLRQSTMTRATMALTATVGREEGAGTSIRAFIDAVPRGRPPCRSRARLAIGKTVLWEAGVQAARDEGFRVLTCRSIEAEAPLSFAGLSEAREPRLRGGGSGAHHSETPGPRGHAPARRPWRVPSRSARNRPRGLRGVENTRCARPVRDRGRRLAVARLSVGDSAPDRAQAPRRPAHRCTPDGSRLCREIRRPFRSNAALAAVTSSLSSSARST